jgi:alkanesulfonate monooxygenase SsuD/methylene tetrahydromethanopterin reductase-like flavin-dependent oxidoreductase (luciferase family)
MKAWQHPDTFAFNGRYNQQRYINIWPRPVQRPHPPVWIPGGGSIETWQWCAEKDYVYSFLSYFGHKVGRATMDGYWAEMDRLGKDRNPYRAAFAQAIAVAETREQAIEIYTEAAEYFFLRCLHVDPRFAAPPGYTTEATMRFGYTSQVSAAAARSLARPTEMKELVEAGYLVIGSPDEVVEQIDELANNLHVGNLMLLMQFGNMSKELTKYNTKLFAERVMPRLRSKFAEHEHRWWPKPMDTASRAELSAYAPA